MTTDNRAQEQAKAQYESICQMLDALDVDYERLEDLREEFAALEGEEQQAASLGRSEWPSDITTNPGEHLINAYDLGRELAELEAQAGDCKHSDAAQEQIHNDPLSVEVRSDWGTQSEELTPGEFRILLCTGGPAVQIRGELDAHGQPDRAWLEYQDWGTPWTQYFEAEQDRLISYARHFFY